MNDTLLHEMIHHLLFERGEPAGHHSNGWRREIMRLTNLITGKEIWAGRSMTKRVKGADAVGLPRPNQGRAARGAVTLTLGAMAAHAGAQC